MYAIMYIGIGMSVCFDMTTVPFCCFEAAGPQLVAAIGGAKPAANKPELPSLPRCFLAPLEEYIFGVCVRAYVCIYIYIYIMCVFSCA